MDTKKLLNVDNAEFNKKGSSSDEKVWPLNAKGVPVGKGGRPLPPARGIGRPKGVPNKSTKAVKDAIAECAEALGGAARMVAWAKEDPANERIFWGTLYPKLIPLQLTGADGGSIKIERIERVIVEAVARDQGLVVDTEFKEIK